MLKRCFLLVFILVMTVYVSACQDNTIGSDGLEDPVYPLLGNGGYKAQHYDIDLVVDIENQSITGAVTIDARTTQNLSAFNLDFEGLEIHSVNINSDPAEYSRQDGELSIMPNSLLLEGESFTISVNYSGRIIEEYDTSLGFSVGWLEYSGMVAAIDPSLWYPNNEGWSNKSTYTQRITVPKPYQILGVGQLKETIQSGNSTTFIWETQTPSLTAPFFIGNFGEEAIEGLNGLPINYYFSADREFGEYDEPVLSVVPEIIEFFEIVFGPFPYQSLNIIYTTQFYAEGVAWPGLIVIHNRSDNLLAHEIAHEWFEQSITPASSEDLWLDEGFATYAEILWQEYLEKPIEGKITEMHTSTSKVNGPLVGSEAWALIYDRGALTLHALRLTVGDEVFFEILETFVERYSHSSASSEDFIVVAEEVSGQDLTDFFDGWLYSEEVPELPLQE